MTLRSADTAMPFSKVWSGGTTGNDTITTRATDNDAAVTTSSGISIHAN